MEVYETLYGGTAIQPAQSAAEILLSIEEPRGWLAILQACIKRPQATGHMPYCMMKELQETLACFHVSVREALKGPEGILLESLR